MTEKDIDSALEILLDNKDFRSKHQLSKHNVKYLRTEASIAKKLNLLFDEGKLKLI